jgi:hypothetical protein
MIESIRWGRDATARVAGDPDTSVDPSVSIAADEFHAVADRGSAAE